MQDKKTQCSNFPGSKDGFTSWSLVCLDSTEKKTSCTDFISKASMTWKSNPKIVSNPIYLEQHHFPGYKTEAEYKFVPVPDLNNLQQYSEVKIRYFFMDTQDYRKHDFRKLKECFVQYFLDGSVKAILNSSANLKKWSGANRCKKNIQDFNLAMNHSP